MSSLFALVALLALAGAAQAQVRGMLRQRSAARSADDAPIVLPPGARVERDLAYGADPQQRMDVYLPAHAKGAPVILMVHGGAWMRGDKASAGVVANKMARWVPQGYIFLSVNYRMSQHPDPIEQADDVAHALAFAQSKAASWGGDPARFILMGHSAGAHLVALVSSAPEIAEKAGARPWLGTVSLDSACLDVVETMTRRHFGFYDQVFGSDPAYWRKASPIHRLAKKTVPMLLVCSSQRKDSCPQARAFAAKAESLGGRASALPVAKSHAEINHDLGASGDYTDKVEDFLRSLGVD